jgi:hypothetical protein
MYVGFHVVCLFVPDLTEINICLEIRVKGTGTNIHANPSGGGQVVTFGQI